MGLEGPCRCVLLSSIIPYVICLTKSVACRILLTVYTIYIVLTRKMNYSIKYFFYFSQFQVNLSSVLLHLFNLNIFTLS